MRRALICARTPIALRGPWQEMGGGREGGAMDYVRRAEITRDIKLDTVEEAFTSRNWIVRIYKVRIAPI